MSYKVCSLFLLYERAHKYKILEESEEVRNYDHADREQKML